MTVKHLAAFKLLLPAVAVFALLYAALRWFERINLYFPDNHLVETPRERGLEFEELHLAASDGVALHGWYMPAAGARRTVLFLHGNGGNISHRLDKYVLFNRMGFSVAAVDYRGYGLSGGRPSEQGTYKDALALYDWLTKVKKLDAGSIVIYGESLGTAVASWLAAQRTPAALLLESPFTSVEDMGRNIYPWLPVGVMVSYKYDTLSRINSVRAPLMVLHSPQDELVPFFMGQRVYDSFNGEKRFVRLAGGHNDGYLVAGPVWVKEVSGFINGLK